MADFPGVLVVWNDLSPENEEEYNEWYFVDHLPDRVGIPGFLTGRRYEVLGPGPRYFTWYLTASVGVMSSPAYLQRMQNPTEWTRRCMPFFKNMNRSACRQTIDMGKGVGIASTTMELKPAAGRQDELRRQISSSLFPDLLRSPGKNGIIRAHLWEADLAVTVQKNPEEAIRGEKDRVVEWVVVLEASSSPSAEKAARELGKYPFSAWGAEPVSPAYVYRLMHYFPGPDGR